VTPWTDAQVWEAVDLTRWRPPGSQPVVAENYELAVTRGVWNLTWIYGFSARDGPHAELLLDEIRRKIESLGGTGTRIWVTPLSRPEGLSTLLERRGFALGDEVEVLAYDLRDKDGRPSPPDFRPGAAYTVREISTEAEYNDFQSVFNKVFEVPDPSPEVRTNFLTAIHKAVRETGHSNQFVAYEGQRPVGTGGLTLVGRASMLWGGAVLSSYRQKGIFGQLVQARCRSAIERGAELAFVVARTGTSGPVLKRHGFRVVGPLATYEARWDTGRPSSAAAH
jgi:GNAT superfamily N-acetyltransferase